MSPMASSYYVNLFAGGCGGWDLAAQRMGIKGVGLEIDPVSCLSRKAAGYETHPGDLRFRVSYHTAEPGLIASPPCQTFAMSGNGSGRKDMSLILEALRVWSWEADVEDPRTALVLEPLRWVMARASAERPFLWIAMEQVPAVMPIWQGYAAILEEIGYFTDVAILDAVHYGVPQNRKRAVLMAHRERRVTMPIPTMPMNKYVGFAEALQLEGDWSLISNNNQGGTGTRGVRHSPDPSFTLTGHCNRMHVAEGHLERPSSTRGVGYNLSIPECLVLQGFPVHHPVRGTTTQQAQQVGDSIPPALAQAILEALIDG